MWYHSRSGINLQLQFSIALVCQVPKILYSSICQQRLKDLLPLGKGSIDAMKRQNWPHFAPCGHSILIWYSQVNASLLESWRIKWTPELVCPIVLSYKCSIKSKWRHHHYCFLNLPEHGLSSLETYRHVPYIFWLKLDASMRWPFKCTSLAYIVFLEITLIARILSNQLCEQSSSSRSSKSDVGTISHAQPEWFLEHILGAWGKNWRTFKDTGICTLASSKGVMALNTNL
jgi:hypothetical protein